MVRHGQGQCNREVLGTSVEQESVRLRTDTKHSEETCSRIPMKTVIATSPPVVLHCRYENAFPRIPLPWWGFTSTPTCQRWGTFSASSSRGIRRRAKQRCFLLTWRSFRRWWGSVPETSRHRLHWRSLGQRLGGAASMLAFVFFC